MTLQLDSRAGSRDLYAPLATILGSKVQMCTLQSGDAAWVGNGPDGPTLVGCEVKSIRDLINSKNEGRLSGVQLVNMANHYEYVYLLIVGEWEPDGQGLLCVPQGKRQIFCPWATGRRQYTTKEVYKFLNSLAIPCNVHMWREPSLWGAANWLAAIYNWWQEDYASHKSHRQKEQRAASIRLTGKGQSEMCKMLQEIQGVGMDRAEAIATRYRCMAELVNGATVEELAGVPFGRRRDGVVLHVGRGTAETILKHLREGE